MLEDTIPTIVKSLRQLSPCPNCSPSNALQLFHTKRKKTLWLLSEKLYWRIRPLLARILREGGRGSICSAWILTFIKIATRVPPPEGIASLPAGPTHIQAQHELRKKVSGTWAQEENLGPRQDPTSDQTTGAVRQSWTPIIGTRILPETPKTPTRRPSEACYSCVAYSWTTRSPRFADSAMPPDHPHVLNIITLLYQCELLWVVVGISVRRSQ